MKICPTCGAEHNKKGPYDKQECYWESLKGKVRLSLRKREIVQCKVCGKDIEVGGRSGRKKGTQFCTDCKYLGRYRKGSKAKELSSEDANYLAGMMDGEGSIFLYKRGKSVALRITVSNNNLAVLERCMSMTGVGSIIWKPRENIKHRTAGTWQVNAQAAESVLIQIAQYMTVKREQAYMAIEFGNKLRIPKEKADKIWQEEWRLRMKKLNERGPQST